MMIDGATLLDLLIWDYGVRDWVYHRGVSGGSSMLKGYPNSQRVQREAHISLDLISYKSFLLSFIGLLAAMRLDGEQGL